MCILPLSCASPAHDDVPCPSGQERSVQLRRAGLELAAEGEGPVESELEGSKLEA